MAHILIGKDGLCFCGCGDKCACNPANVGSGYRCNAAIIKSSGHTPVQVANEKSDDAMQKFLCIEGKEKHLEVKVKCVYD